ncbi:MAG: energy-coupling factor transporter transmembrane protein EcfT, partial [Micrococcales bacterium]|nr:energy-coupling factor transporter transmembrane protein EcfT [Micrococcales bacterium]
MSGSVHPGAWWAWALALALAASATTNPLVLGLLACLSVLVTVVCRQDQPWVASLRLYLLLALAVLVIRLFFYLVFAAQTPALGPVVLPAPTLTVPGTGLVLFGPVHFDAFYGGLRDALRLATLILCVGAANCLASPKKTLAALPHALRQVGTALVVALTVFPQLAQSVVRVRRTAHLRGPAPNRRAAALRVVFPVLADSLDRSLGLAASLECRGYGQGGIAASRPLRVTRTVTMCVSMALMSGGAMALSGALALPGWVGVVALAAGLGGLAWTARSLGQGRTISRYRPGRWGPKEWLVLGSGLAVPFGLLVATVLSPGWLNPSALIWPTLPWPAAIGLASAALPLLLATTETKAEPAADAAGQ